MEKNKSINLSNELSEDLLEDIDLTDDKHQDLCKKNEEQNNLLQLAQSTNLNLQVELNSHLIEERNKEIEQIHKKVVIINEIFKDLNLLVNEQAIPIANIEKNMIKSEEYCEKQLEILRKIEHNQKSSQLKQQFLLLSTIGLIINAPVAVLLGLKVGLISGLGTVGLSAVTTFFKKK
jgi:hypothetical protein